MIDPLFCLALSMHANPGVYALLLGSGVSRAAGIPTGWEIVLDLTRKLAELEGEACEPDPAAWFHKKHGREPDYSQLLNAISSSPAERQQLLRSYFEPTEDEREQGIKQPTAAHRAIAELVARGFVRVILTTNFDRLLERAIEEQGVSPAVISTPDAADGALPLAHQKRCVVKLHGDYLDTRILNTPKELGKYDKRINTLLDQVFDQFGVIACGWSAQWDTALRAAVERCRTRRFSFVWTVRSEPGEEARRLVDLRGGEVIRIQDADSFFGKLAASVGALVDSRVVHPNSIQAAVSLLKRHISDSRYSVQLEDLLVDEAEVVYQGLADFNESFARPPRFDSQVEVWSQRHREIIERLQALIITRCAFAKADQFAVLVDAIERIARAAPSGDGRSEPPESVRFYSPAVLFYAGGLVAVARQKYDLLSSWLTVPKVRENRDVGPLLLRIDWQRVSDRLKRIDKHKRQHVPLSEHLFEVLREPLRRFVPDDAAYDEVFDRFEYIRALVYLDIAHAGKDPAGSFAPYGRFAYRYERGESWIGQVLARELQTACDSLPLLQAGLFGGAPDRFRQVKAALDDFVGRLGLPWRLC